MSNVIPISAHPKYRCNGNLQKSNSLIFWLDDNSELTYGYSKPGYYFWNKEYSEVYGPFKTMSMALKAVDEYLNFDSL